jgi:hypothetical protein
MPVVRINGKSQRSRITLPAVRGVLGDDTSAKHNRLLKRREMHASKREKLFDPEQINLLRNKLNKALLGSQEDLVREKLLNKNVIQYNPAQTLKSLAQLLNILKKEYSLKLSKKDDANINQRFTEFMKEAKSALKEIYSFKIPSDPSNRTYENGSKMPIIFNTPFETDKDRSKDDFFSLNAELMTDDGDFKKLSKRFEDLIFNDKTKALKLVYDPIKKLSEEVWSKLNHIAGNEGFHRLEHLTKERSVSRPKHANEKFVPQAAQSLPNPLKKGDVFADLDYKRT